jgi:uncharacterized membrane protein
VTLNPAPMLGFAAAIVALTVVAMLPLFLGLVLVLPVLGHATWHLYRRVVLPPAPEAAEWPETADMPCQPAMDTLPAKS